MNFPVGKNQLFKLTIETLTKRTMVSSCSGVFHIVQSMELSSALVNNIFKSTVQAVERPGG